MADAKLAGSHGLRPSARCGLAQNVGSRRLQNGIIQSGRPEPTALTCLEFRVSDGTRSV